MPNARTLQLKEEEHGKSRAKEDERGGGIHVEGLVAERIPGNSDGERVTRVRSFMGDTTTEEDWVATEATHRYPEGIGQQPGRIP